MAVEFTKSSQDHFAEILGRYPNKRAAIMPTLWLAQKEFGHLSNEVMVYVAGLLDLTPAFVASVATFYTMYYKRPMGRHHVQVCTNLSCALVGSGEILACLEERLGIRPGQTTADGLFSLDEVECLASCGTAPMMQIDDDYWEDLSTEKTLEIIDRLAADAADPSNAGD